MAKEFASLREVQGLVLDLIKVQRNHRIPGEETRENVVEHSFSTAILCWKLFESIHPPLSLEKILKYALIHDALERGQKFDTNTYAGQDERTQKKEREANELLKLKNEFGDFRNFVDTLNTYERLGDEEAIFVWSVDKMQAMILGGIDDWRPYALYGVTYDQFCKKGEEILKRGSSCLYGVIQEVIEESKKTYYDRPREGEA
jgi:5'-deoxynucleotidase YfbR-like HD superfamily hydrolase